MAAVMISCPMTGVEVRTGFAVDTDEYFRTAIYVGMGVRCPSCDDWHAWSKADAFLREELRRDERRRTDRRRSA
jgi:hypothetical protein